MLFGRLRAGHGRSNDSQVQNLLRSSSNGSAKPVHDRSDSGASGSSVGENREDERARKLPNR